jgi:predicted O-methyltransferase YrrM
MSALAEYYKDLGFPPSAWHIGPEHPALERVVLRLLNNAPAARVLEIGYQSGGFAVPIVLALHARPGFQYVGIDSLAYSNAVPGDVIARFLRAQGVKDGFEFVTGDAGQVLRRFPPRPFDLVLIDHYKPLYPRELLAVARRGFVGADGVVVLHDVLGRARSVCGTCRAICRAWGFDWTVTAEVPEGLAVARRVPSPRRLPLATRARRVAVAARVAVETFKLGRRGRI